MGSLIETFHIDIKLIVAQLVNFLIVAAVLWFFAVKPLMKIMQQRTNKIEKSLKDARKIEERLKVTEEESRKIIKEAQKQAADLLEQAKVHSENKKKEITLQAKEEVNKIVGESKKQISAEKEKMVKEVKEEIIDLVILASEKVLGREIDAKANKELIAKAVKEINKGKND